MPLRMLMLRSMGLCAFCHDHAWIYLFMCSLPCFVVRSISLSALCLVHVSRSTCWLLCHMLLKPFYLLLFLFSCVLALLVGCRSRSCGLGQYPYTKAYIKGFGSFPLCISMFACLLLCSISMFACLDLGFTMLCALVGLCLSDFEATCLRGCVHPSCGLFGCYHLWDTPPWCWCVCFTPFSTLCDVDILALLALCHPFGFLCFFASFHTCLHVHAWVYVSSIL